MAAAIIIEIILKMAFDTGQTNKLIFVLSLTQ